MKKYIDAQLQVVRVKNNDILTISGAYGDATSVQLGADRFRDFEDYSY